MKLVSTNYFGISIIGMSIITFIILLTVSLSYARINHNACGAVNCSISNHIPVQSYVGFGLLIATTSIGGYLTFLRPKVEKTQTISKAKLNKAIENLENEEKKVFSELTKNDGSVFQNDLINTTGFSKVKVSRILDKLETKGIVERRRRGMSNIVILKM